MTPERFVELARTYGGQLRRWPVAEQAPAQALLDAADARALAALQHEQWLDQQMESHQLAPLDAALVRQIRLSAPMRRRSFWARYRNWLSPAGFIGAGIAGIAAGILVASLNVPLPTLGPEVLPSVFDQGDAEVVFTVNAEESEQ